MFGPQHYANPQFQQNRAPNPFGVPQQQGPAPAVAQPQPAAPPPIAPQALVQAAQQRQAQLGQQFGQPMQGGGLPPEAQNAMNALMQQGGQLPAAPAPQQAPLQSMLGAIRAAVGQRHERQGTGQVSEKEIDATALGSGK